MIDELTDRDILIAGGGTAGHLLPGIAIAGALVAAGRDPSSIHFVGGNRGVERELVGSAGYELTELPGRGIQRRLTIANLAAVWGLFRAVIKGAAHVRRTRPGLVVMLGGYASFACGVGAVLSRIPIVQVEQNIRAGAVNRSLRWFAKASAVSFPGTDLPRATVTGNPLRPEVINAARRMVTAPGEARHEARAALDLPDDRLVVVVATGSLGSRRVNTAVRGVVAQWSDRTDLAVRHVIGRRDFADYMRDAPVLPADGLIYQPVEYEDQMEYLLAAADVAVTRAGGGVAELAAFGVPSILVPLPIAPRDHQRANAAYFVDADAAVLLEDEACNVDGLTRALTPLLEQDDTRRTMAANMLAQARLDAASRAATLVEDVLHDL